MFGYLIGYSMLFVCCMATGEDDGKPMKKWAVLVAGSNGFDNYRHQADVAHAYHILTKHGIPAKQIITFAYDDIANNSENPFPGKIFNDYSHTDYYAGSVIDYKGEDVTPTMFTRVLKGDAALKNNGRKVLESGPNDHVFIYFTDHGAPDLIAFPDDEMHSDELNDTITFLYENKRYAKLVFYIEACESGSMFDHILSTRINVFATTAANPNESSYATFCDDPTIDACLADEYSYNWLNDSDTHDLTKLTLKQQFLHVRKKTIESHVQQYGDKKLGKLAVSKFQGDKKVLTLINHHSASEHRVPSRHTHIHAMVRAMLRADSSQKRSLAKRRLMRAIQLGVLSEETMNIIVDTVQLKSSTRMSEPVSINERLTCYKIAFKAFTKRCFSIQRIPEVGEHVRKLRNLCADGVTASDIVAAIEKSCP